MKTAMLCLIALLMGGCATVETHVIDAPQWVIEETFCAGADGLLSVEEQRTYPAYVIVRCHDGQYHRYSYESFNNILRRGY